MDLTVMLLSLTVIKLLTCTVTGAKIIEGDILLSEPSSRYVKTHAAAAPGPTRFWDQGNVPVHIDFPEGSNAYTLVKRALENVASATGCLTFPDKVADTTDYVKFTGQNRGCYSEVGFKGGQQLINIAPECESTGIIMHEILHTLGLWHEHSRSDRDRYVDIYLNHIIPGERRNFDLRKGSEDLEKDNPYDFLSIMHYKYNQFSLVPSWDTIVPNAVYSRFVKKKSLGQRERLTSRDVNKLKWLYKQCTRHDESDVTSTPNKLNYVVGDAVEFNCNSNYNLIGAKSSTCLRNGKWAGSLPICVDMSKLFRQTNYLRALIYENMEQTPEFVNINHNSAWQGHQGKSLSENSGPITDHTYAMYDVTTNTSKGAFYFFNSAGLREKTIADMHTPFIYSPNDDVSILFFYSMNGTGVGTLNITVFDYIDWSHRSGYVWTISGPTPDRGWHCKHIPGTDTGKKGAWKKIKFTAISGSNDAAIIAVDDILIGPSAIVDKFAKLQGCGSNKLDEHDSIAGLGEPGMKYT